MKLRTLNCSNCEAPLRQEGDKLVCAYCGGTFDIPTDATDSEYEKIINAEDYIRLSLAKSILGLEKKYATQQQINQAKRDEQLRQKRARMVRAVIKGCVSIMFAMLILFGMIFLVLKFGGNSKKNNTSETTEVTWNPGYRITPSDLRADKDFAALIDGGMIEDERSGYDDRGAIIFSSEDIWNISKDPEILVRYLITEEESNALYVVYKITFETNDGRVKEMYDCQAYEDLKINDDGKIEYYRKEGKITDDYDFRFHANPELEPLMEQYINCNFNDSNKYIFEF